MKDKAHRALSFPVLPVSASGVTNMNLYPIVQYCVSPCFRWILLGGLVIGLCSDVTAETVFLGPITYRSAADSPFDLSGLGETFFLEDFEDGEMNTPGISQPMQSEPVPSDVPLIDVLSVFQATPHGPSS